MNRRTPLDRTARRYFVYVLSDADGAVLYVGRSRNVATRLLGHYSDASNPDTMQALRKAMWFQDVRKVDMTGPLTWDEAVKLGRRLIEDEQPFGNVSQTRRDPKKWSGARRRALRAAS